MTKTTIAEAAALSEIAHARVKMASAEVIRANYAYKHEDGTLEALADALAAWAAADMAATLGQAQWRCADTMANAIREMTGEAVPDVSAMGLRVQFEFVRLAGRLAERMGGEE